MTTLGDWGSFFTAEAGASAALAGLLFVGISLNLAKIVAAAGLPNRALQALTLLFGILLVASLALVPGQSVGLVGLELAFLGAAIVGVALTISLRSLAHTDAAYRRWHLGETTVVGVATALYPIAGVLMLLRGAVGLYLVVPAFLVSFVIALLDTWVLLVEINR